MRGIGRDFEGARIQRERARRRRVLAIAAPAVGPGAGLLAAAMAGLAVLGVLVAAGIGA